jgi:deoxycytidylate deaminase
MLVLKDGTKIYGKNSQQTKVTECPRVTLGVSDYGPCDAVCHQQTHAERDAIWKALSMGYDVEGSTMFLTGHWICCDDCRRSMKVTGVKECYLLNSGDKIINYVDFSSDAALGIMDKDYTEAMQDYLSD